MLAVCSNRSNKVSEKQKRTRKITIMGQVTGSLIWETAWTGAVLVFKDRPLSQRLGDLSQPSGQHRWLQLKGKPQVWWLCLPGCHSRWGRREAAVGIQGPAVPAPNHERCLSVSPCAHSPVGLLLLQQRWRRGRTDPLLPTLNSAVRVLQHRWFILCANRKRMEDWLAKPIPKP